jgi:hypothetical protein
MGDSLDQTRKQVSTAALGASAVEAALRTASAEIAFALGLIRVLTLLPLYDGTLDDVERHLASSRESLLQLLRELEDVARAGGGS